MKRKIIIELEVDSELSDADLYEAADTALDFSDLLHELGCDVEEPVRIASLTVEGVQ